MKVIYSKDFSDDLDAVADFIGRDDPERAETFVKEIAWVCAFVVVPHPLIGRSRPEFGGYVYSFATHHRLIFYTFDTVFNRLIFHRLIKRQDVSGLSIWADR